MLLLCVVVVGDDDSCMVVVDVEGWVWILVVDGLVFVWMELLFVDVVFDLVLCEWV